MGLDILQTDLAKVLGHDPIVVLPVEGTVDSQTNAAHSDTRQSLDTSSPIDIRQEQALEWYRLSQEIEANTHVAVDVLNGEFLKL
jgi:hypothetical protein